MRVNKCNDHQNKIGNIYIAPKSSFIPFCSQSPLPSLLLATNDLLSGTMILSFFNGYVNGNI